jgi:hypothetical protein
LKTETPDDGNKYRLMVLVATEKKSGAHVGAVLTCEYTHAKNGYEFFMWTGAHPVGRALHTLLAEVTPQERLDTHWQGFVANLEEKQANEAASLGRAGTS